MIPVLIAIMTSIFEEAEDKAEAKMYICRACLILEFEAAMGSKDATTQAIYQLLVAHFLVAYRSFSNRLLVTPGGCRGEKRVLPGVPARHATAQPKDAGGSIRCGWRWGGGAFESIPSGEIHVMHILQVAPAFGSSL